MAVEENPVRAGLAAFADQRRCSRASGAIEKTGVQTDVRPTPAGMNLDPAGAS
jgi:hypothetical protein